MLLYLWIAAVVLASLAQAIAVYWCALLWDSKFLYVTFISASAVSIPFYSVFFLAARRSGGFLPEVYGKQLFKSFAGVGLATAINYWGRSLTYIAVPITLQVTLSQSMIPIIVCIILSCSLKFRRAFTARELQACVIIAMGAFAHVAAFYFTMFADAKPGISPFNTLWWIVLHCLSLIPVALSAIHQQEYFSTLRLNVIYMLYYTTIFQVLFSVLLLPVNIAFNISFEPSGGVQLHILVTRLAFLVVSTLCAQLSQAALVRHVHYEAAAFTMMIIPSVVFATALIASFVGATVFDSQRKIPLTSPSIIADIVCYSVVLFGVYLYRFNMNGTLSLVYVFQAPPFLGERESMMRYFAPALHIEKDAVVDALEAEPNNLLNKKPPLEDAAIMIRTPKSQGQLLQPAVESVEQIQRRVHPFFLPSAATYPRTILPVLPPVLMNLWSGAIICEYTDYKRYFDAGLATSFRDLHSHSTEMEAQQTPPSCYLWNQYTKSHVAGLTNIEHELRQLYEYHRMGTIAASLLLDPTLENSAEAGIHTPSSVTSNASSYQRYS